MTTEYWFPTPIFGRDITGDTLQVVQDQIGQVINTVHELRSDSPWGDAVTTTFEFNGKNDISIYKLDALKDQIFIAVNEYCDALKYPGPDFKLLESWFNFCDIHGYQYDHTHPKSRISGVYYYASTGEDGSIRFQNPNPIMQFNGFPSDRVGIDAVTYKPKVGRLLLFPSWLTHRVNLNNTDNQRISIAFNLV